jgi:hypothetical protein
MIKYYFDHPYSKILNDTTLDRQTSSFQIYMARNEYEGCQLVIKSEFKEFAKIRNGVESIPSTLRRKYQVDKMPVRGKLRTKLFFGFKIAAMNFNKLRDYLKLGDNYTQNNRIACVYCKVDVL